MDSRCLRCLALLICFSCNQEAPAERPGRPAHVAASGSAPARLSIVDATFSRAYQIFMFRTLSTAVKNDHWTRAYKDRWVRWTGMLVAITTDGLKFKHLQSTVTFDTAVLVVQPQRAQLRKLLTVGKFYTYIARLARYDDVFRTFYLDQGVVERPGPDGVPGELVQPPRPLTQIPVEERARPQEPYMDRAAPPRSR